MRVQSPQPCLEHRNIRIFDIGTLELWDNPAAPPLPQGSSGVLQSILAQPSPHTQWRRHGSETCTDITGGCSRSFWKSSKLAGRRQPNLPSNLSFSSDYDHFL